MTDAAAAATAESGVNKRWLLLGVAGAVLLLDLLTKQWIVQTMIMHETRPVLGEFFRLTYTHNPGAAFGLNIGEHSRLFFLALSLVALGVLGWMYAATPRGDVLRLSALALVCGGATGNILDRVRYEAGVVDFIDVGVGGFRFWIFNVADSAVSVGAVLLLVSFYLEERREQRGRDAVPAD
ncbi:MAG: signal peptidase II [Gemmatimonadota bacterium]